MSVYRAGETLRPCVGNEYLNRAAEAAAMDSRGALARKQAVAQCEGHHRGLS